MTGRVPAGDSGFRSEPGAVIAAIVAGIEPGLGQAGIAAAIVRAAPSRAQQRRLADALTGDPGLLTTGHPGGPPQIELLIRALRELGAQRLALPRCAHCGQPRRLVQCDGSLRICSTCDRRRRGAAEPCAVCGNTGQVAYRDQHGRPRCARCRPYDGPDPVTSIMARVSRLDPGLDQARVREVIQQAIPQPFQHHQVLWELDQHPGLLTGQGAHGSPRVNALIWGLLAAGRRHRGASMPVLRPDGAVESPARRTALLPPLLRPRSAPGLRPLPAAHACRQPHRGRATRMRQLLPPRPGQPSAMR